MSDILSKIVATKREEVAAQQKALSFEALVDEAKRFGEQQKTRGFMAALQAKIEARQTAIIAEVKKASPSKGVIRADFDAVAIAKAYEQAGATCLSVLTDELYFQGKPEYLQMIREQSALPLLRKDFVIDPYQIVQSRLWGADAILLIVAILNDDELLSYTELAQQWGLDVLVEVHDEEECERALKLPVSVIGVNNRNLRNFSISLETSIRLKQQMPEGYQVICESGIERYEDVLTMQQAGIYGFLVGSSLMASPDVGKALRQLMG
ncbi:MAG: indole-3-glycerol phosphate synthase TrpC [Cardiobacteriaceae bacterium]|nr:indole-3-glycerol phosphate synthase TrpC [Cardiobacteriaceae bacterium]